MRSVLIHVLAVLLVSSTAYAVCNPTCANGGTCDSSLCVCSSAFTGPSCATIVDLCESSPCSNGGSCVQNGTEASCDCVGHYTGDACENDPCTSSPCLYGGNCTIAVFEELLASAATFAVFGGTAGVTSSGVSTVITGNLGSTGASTLVTGFHDTNTDCTYTETTLNKGFVDGLIYTAAPPPTAGCQIEGTTQTHAIATAARGDIQTAFTTLAGLPFDVSQAQNLGGLTLTPNTYSAAASSFIIEGGDLTLDALGDSAAIFVFQMASTLRIGGPGAAAPQNIILAGGAQAKNIFWQIGSSGIINAGGGGTVYGTFIAAAGVAISTAGNVALVTINGRVLSTDASVTMVNTVINAPSATPDTFECSCASPFYGDQCELIPEPAVNSTSFTRCVVHLYCTGDVSAKSNNNLQATTGSDYVRTSCKLQSSGNTFCSVDLLARGSNATAPTEIITASFFPLVHIGVDETDACTLGSVAGGNNLVTGSVVKQNSASCTVVTSRFYRAV